MIPSKRFDCSVDIEKGYVATCRKKENYGSTNKQTGYKAVMLKERGSKFFAPYYVHRIVWETANGTPVPPGFHIHHQDSNKENNSIFNLSCVTAKLNNWFAARNRDYKAIYETRKKNGFKSKTVAIGPNDKRMEFPSMRQAALHFGCNPTTVSCIINKKKYYTKVLHKGEEWTFVRG